MPQASLLAPRSVEALVLKGNLLLELKKTQEAVVHFREAMQIASYRYEPVHGLVQCYVYLNRCKEAIALANNACKEMGFTARALTVSGGESGGGGLHGAGADREWRGGGGGADRE